VFVPPLKDQAIMSEPLVYVLHAVDTEGPLYESPTETVLRINRITGLSLEASAKTLRDLLSGKISLGDKQQVVSVILKYSKFLGDWSQVGDMLKEVTSAEFRDEHAGTDGTPWTFNWHVMDHIGYDINPRRRDIGYHNIFDYYQQLIAETPCRDQLGFHFHPEHYYAHAHMCGTNYSTSRYLYQILSRKLIERQWFPKSFRAGFHTERQDSHLFLEQWIPHDFSNQRIEGIATEQGQLDLSDHRFGDWNRAPTAWGYYHPHHDDYQSSGSCRRRIFRCLNIGTRIRCIDEREVAKAFEQARTTERPVVVCVTNHDFRPMGPDITWLKNAFDAQAKRLGIGWKSASIDDSFFDVRGPATTCSWQLQQRESGTRLTLEYSQKLFGPQPFMAIKLVNELFHHINLDVVEPFRRFTYVFDDNTLPLHRVESISVATNDTHGNTVITQIKPDSRSAHP